MSVRGTGPCWFLELLLNPRASGYRFFYSIVRDALVLMTFYSGILSLSSLPFSSLTQCPRHGRLIFYKNAFNLLLLGKTYETPDFKDAPYGLESTGLNTDGIVHRASVRLFYFHAVFFVHFFF